MSNRMSQREFSESLDKRLSGLQEVPWLEAKVLAKAEGEKLAMREARAFREHLCDIFPCLKERAFTCSVGRHAFGDLQLQQCFLVDRQREVVLQVCLGLFGHIADEINIQPGRTGGVVRFRRGLSRCDESSQEHHQSCQSGNCFPDHIISPRHIMIMSLVH